MTRILRRRTLRNTLHNSYFDARSFKKEMNVFLKGPSIVDHKVQSLKSKGQPRATKSLLGGRKTWGILEYSFNNLAQLMMSEKSGYPISKVLGGGGGGMYRPLNLAMCRTATMPMVSSPHYG